MTQISIIGLGGMARALGARAAGAGHDVQLLGRHAAKAAALATDLGERATAGVIGDALTGDLVVLAVPFPAAGPIVTGYGPALAGKVVVDISNPFDARHTGLVVARETSGAEEIAAVADPGASVVKAFNTLFADVVARGDAVDVLLAGDGADAKAAVSDFVAGLGLRPVDTGGLAFAHWLEGAGLLVLGQAVRQGDFTLTFEFTNRKDAP